MRHSPSSLLSLVKLTFLLTAVMFFLVACRNSSNPAVITTVPEATHTPRTTPRPPLAIVSPTAEPSETATNRPVSPTPAATNTRTTSTPRPTVTPSRTSSPTPAVTSTSTLTVTLTPTADPAEGGLVALRMESQVGVLLDEFPPDQRDRVAQALLDQAEAIWLERALRQIELTYNRLHFRDYVYRKVGFPDPKGQLPWPPRELWQVSLDPAGPQRVQIGSHDLVMVGYTFASTLLTSKAEPGRAEPALEEVGGVWQEPFLLPADPTQLLQRTGNACINEGGFPPNSYDSENLFTFYDFSCQANDGGMAGCHRTNLPTLSCQEALNSRVGIVETVMEFERLPWSAALADEVRVGEVTTENAPDLLVVGEEMQNYRIIYQYFPNDSCALAEACVGAPGWRRLLKFDAVVHNIGGQPLDIGPVTGEDPRTNVFVYDACHNHIHYSNYGDFLFGEEAKPNKRAFCIESTGRYSNNEFAPLTHDYSCRVQGIEAGWVDEYGAGLDCQWIDITDEISPSVPITATLDFPLSFRSNPDRFLCEGELQFDEDGQRQWAFSGLYNEEGLPMAYPVCDLSDGWDENNFGTTQVQVPAVGSYVTEPCASGEAGPLRNCGFTPATSNLTCDAGQTVQMQCRINSFDSTAAPQVLRVCESSHLLKTGTACVYETALANKIITTEAVEVSFMCPRYRDAQEPGGLYSFYSAPLFGEDNFVSVSCTVQNP